MLMLKAPKPLRSMLLVVACGLFLVLPATPVFGATTPAPATPTTQGQGLEISPPLIELKADPGQKITTEIKLRNVTKATVIAKPTIEDFVAKGEDGQADILSGDSTSPYSLKDWLEQIAEQRITPQEQKAIKINIDIPSDASPGGHYGVVRFTATPEGLTSTGVSLSASLGSLILINVSGDVKESAKIETFTVSRNKKAGSFFEYGPLTFTERINNTGNVHFKPSGDIILKNTFGKQVASLKINEKRGNILPASIRKFEQQYKKTKLFGRYTATLTVLYGSTNQTLTKSISFWVIPYKLVLVILLSLIILIVLVRFILKAYKRHLLKNVPQNNSPSAPPTNNTPSAQPPASPPSNTPESTITPDAPPPPIPPDQQKES